MRAGLREGGAGAGEVREGGAGGGGAPQHAGLGPRPGSRPGGK